MRCVVAMDTVLNKSRREAILPFALFSVETQPCQSAVVGVRGFVNWGLGFVVGVPCFLDCVPSSWTRALFLDWNRFTGAGHGGTSVCRASARLLATNFVCAASIGYGNNQMVLG